MPPPSRSPQTLRRAFAKLGIGLPLDAPLPNKALHIPSAAQHHRYRCSGIPRGSGRSSASRLGLVVSKICGGNVVLEGLAQDARLAKKGAWADSQPVPLWERWKRK